MDAEFIGQALCLEHGWREANTLRALEKGRNEKVLPEAGVLIENYQRLRRVEGILRRCALMCDQENPPSKEELLGNQGILGHRLTLEQAAPGKARDTGR